MNLRRLKTSHLVLAVAALGVTVAILTGSVFAQPTWRESIADKLHRLVSRPRPETAHVVESPEDLEIIAEIYRKASDEARQNVADLKAKIGRQWEATREDIGQIWARAAEDSEHEVAGLQKKARELRHHRGEAPGVAERALEEAARRIQRIYQDAAVKARERASQLSGDVTDSWESYRDQIGNVYTHSAREAEEQVRHLSQLASDIAKHLDTEPSPGAGLGLESGRPSERSALGRAADTAGRYVRGAADTLKEGTEKVAEGGRSAYESLKSKIVSIYSTALASAQRQVAALKRSSSDTWADAQRKISDIYARSSQEAEEQVAELRRGVSGSLGQAASEGFETVKDVGYRAYEKATEGAQAVGSKLRDAVSAASPGHTCFTLGQWYERALEQARHKVDQLPRPYGDSWESIKSRISDVYEHEFGDVDKRILDLKSELDDAEHRKAELERTRERVRNLEPRTGESWDSQKRRIAALYDEAIQSERPSTWQRVKGAMSGFFGRKSGEPADEISQAYDHALESVKHKLKRGLHANDFDDMKRQIVDAFESAYTDAESQAGIRRKPESELSASDRRRMHMLESYKHAAKRALDRAGRLRENRGEEYPDAKKRIMDVFESAFSNVEEAPTAIGEAWKTAKDKLTTAWESAKPLVTKPKAKRIYGASIANADFEARGLLENRDEPYAQRRNRIASVYEQAMNKADRELAPLEREMEEAQREGKPVPAELAQEYKCLLMYHNSMYKALIRAKSLRDLGESFPDTKARIRELFEDAFQTAEHNGDVSEASWLVKMRSKFAQQLESAVAAVGLRRFEF